MRETPPVSRSVDNGKEQRSGKMRRGCCQVRKDESHPSEGGLRVVMPQSGFRTGGVASNLSLFSSRLSASESTRLFNTAHCS
jgi:hypothetical protein